MSDPVYEKKIFIAVDRGDDPAIPLYEEDYFESIEDTYKYIEQYDPDNQYGWDIYSVTIEKVDIL